MSWKDWLLGGPVEKSMNPEDDLMAGQLYGGSHPYGSNTHLTASELERRMKEIIQGGAHSHTIGGYAAPGTYTSAKPDLASMLRSRMRLAPHENMPFDFIQAHQIDDARVVVFIVSEGQPSMIEDDGHLFPSDKLITQLRMIMKG